MTTINIEAHARTIAPVSLIERMLADTLGWPEWSTIDHAEIDTPGVAGPGSVGEVRTFRSGRTVGVEEVIASDDIAHGLRYRLLSGLPLKDYVGQIAIADRGEDRLIVWTASFHRPFPGLGGLVARRMTAFLQSQVNGLAAHATLRDDEPRVLPLRPRGAFAWR